MDDNELLERVRGGDERAFSELVRRYQSTLVRVARYYVNSEATALDVAQDTWLAVLKGLDRFEGRSSFKTWLLHILVNRARTSGTKEARTLAVDPTGASVAASRFDAGGLWNEPPVPFTDSLDDAIANADLLAQVRSSIDGLDEPYRSVVTLRDVQGLSTGEVADVLELTEGNVRVILHRGRSRVRSAVESTWRGGQP